VGLAGGATAALSLAFSFFFWSAAVVAEVYTFQAFLLSLLLYLLAAWDQRHLPWALPMLGLVLGLSLAHHVSTLLLLPGLVLLAFTSASGHIARPKTWLTGCLLVIPGLLSYLYLPLRSRVGATPNFNSWYDAEGIRHTVDLATWDGFWEVVSGRSFAHLVFAYAPGQAVEEAVQALTRFWGNFLGIGVVVGVVGAAYLFTRDRGKASGLAIAMLSYAFFFVNYGAADKESMFLPVYTLWTLYMAYGYDLLFRWAGEAWHGMPGCGTLGASVGVAGAVVLSALLIAVNMPYVNISHDDAVRTRAQSLFDTLPPNAVVVGGWGSVIGMIYLQEVEGQRSDVKVMVVDHLSGSRPEMLEFLETRVGTEPIFSMQYDQQFAAKFRLVPFSHGYELMRR
ncbi:MAG TPA: DUF2723 domain-containing protein, partial [Thermoleophilia bacterium]|nr:DUF2723 domain-containing protein [Thermoleophilia bacterium]